MENEEKFRTIIKEKIEEGNTKKFAKLLQHDKELKMFFIEETSFLKILSYEPIIQQRMWHVFNKTNEIPKCQKCGNEVKFRGFLKGYRKGCSLECSNALTVNKTTITSLNKYNTEHPFQSKEIQSRAKETIALHKINDPNWIN